MTGEGRKYIASICCKDSFKVQVRNGVTADAACRRSASLCLSLSAGVHHGCSERINVRPIAPADSFLRAASGSRSHPQQRRCGEQDHGLWHPAQPGVPQGSACHQAPSCRAWRHGRVFSC
jgi:hypothetical protein